MRKLLYGAVAVLALALLGVNYYIRMPKTSQPAPESPKTQVESKPAPELPKTPAKVGAAPPTVQPRPRPQPAPEVVTQPPEQVVPPPPKVQWGHEIPALRPKKR